MRALPTVYDGAHVELDEVTVLSGKRVELRGRARRRSRSAATASRWACCPASPTNRRWSRCSRARSPSSADSPSGQFLNDHTSSSVGLAAVTTRPGRSLIRNASPACNGSARLDRASDPVATKTCWSESSGRVTVSPGESRATQKVALAVPSRTFASGW